MSLSESRRAELTVEALKLDRVEGLSERAIAKRLKVARGTVRRLLGKAPWKVREPTPRLSILDRFMPEVRRWVEATPEIKAPAVVERLRPLG